MFIRLASFSVSLSLLFACTEGDPSTARCYFQVTAVSADEEALGTTPADLAAEIEADTEHAAEWVDDSETVATLSILLDVDNAEHQRGCGIESLSVPATVVVSTDDGSVEDEVFAGDVAVLEDGTTRFNSEHTDVAGVPSTLDANEVSLGYTLDLDWNEAMASGALSEHLQGEDAARAWDGSNIALRIDQPG